MKRILTINIVLIAMALSSTAQLNVQITDAGGIVQNESTYVVYGDPSTSTMDIGMYSENLSSGNIVVNVKRYETGVQSGTKNFFCWGICYGAIDAGSQPLWISQDVVDMDPGVEYNNFHAYHQPEDLIGQSCYRYVWMRRGTVVHRMERH